MTSSTTPFCPRDSTAAATSCRVFSLGWTACEEVSRGAALVALPSLEVGTADEEPVGVVAFFAFLDFFAPAPAPAPGMVVEVEVEVEVAAGAGVMAFVIDSGKICLRSAAMMTALGICYAT